MDFSNQIATPPKGPDLTFVCMRIENKAVLQSELSDDKFMTLMQIFKEIMAKALKQFHGHCIEQPFSYIYDALTVFNDVYDAIRCAINMQKALNSYQWPSYLHLLQMSSSRMTYVGTGDHGIQLTMCTFFA